MSGTGAIRSFKQLKRSAQSLPVDSLLRRSIQAAPDTVAHSDYLARAETLIALVFAEMERDRIERSASRSVNQVAIEGEA